MGNTEEISETEKEQKSIQSKAVFGKFSKIGEPDQLGVKEGVHK